MSSSTSFGPSVVVSVSGFSSGAWRAVLQAPLRRGVRGSAPVRCQSPGSRGEVPATGLWVSSLSLQVGFPSLSVPPVRSVVSDLCTARGGVRGRTVSVDLCRTLDPTEKVFPVMTLLPT